MCAGGATQQSIKREIHGERWWQLHDPSDRRADEGRCSAGPASAGQLSKSKDLINHEVVEFRILSRRSKVKCKTTAVRADFGLFKDLLERVL